MYERLFYHEQNLYGGENRAEKMSCFKQIEHKQCKKSV